MAQTDSTEERLARLEKALANQTDEKLRKKAEARERAAQARAEEERLEEEYRQKIRPLVEESRRQRIPPGYVILQESDSDHSPFHPAHADSQTDAYVSLLRHARRQWGLTHEIKVIPDVRANVSEWNFIHNHHVYGKKKVRVTEQFGFWLILGRPLGSPNLEGWHACPTCQGAGLLPDVEPPTEPTPRAVRRANGRHSRTA